MKPKLRTECFDPRCDWAITSSNPVESGIALAEHHTRDPRHTGGRWIDRDGNERRGFDRLDAP